MSKMSGAAFCECDEFFMRRAIELARGGEGWTNPNPLVGAVLVKDGAIIGEGFHHKYGALHAEREALADCARRGNTAHGATAYVTLEPCAHFGKQPPCSHALVEAGVTRVIVGSRDPNPLVHGKGNEYLRAHGITVCEDFLREECDALNPIFFHYITKGTPFVSLKYAMTADGKIATKTGASKWITGEQSRAFVHRLRNRYAAILAGIGTVLADDPLLTCRLPDGELASQPLRVILDSALRIPMESAIVKTAAQFATLIVACESGDERFAQKKADLERAGAEVLVLAPDADGKPDLRVLMQALGERKIDSVLIEGGGEVNYGALNAGIVSHVYAFVAPKIFGGAGKSPVAGAGVCVPAEAFGFTLCNVRRFGDDVLLEFNASKKL